MLFNKKYSGFSVFIFLILSIFLISSVAPGATPADKKKKEALASIDKHQAEIIALSDRIWQLAETALEETQSSKLLADYAEAQGFKVERGVAGLPTAFIATYGQGRPVIGVLGEYDALPGLSQKTQPVKEALQPGAAGQGCGHNLLGTAALSSALAIKELIEAGKLKGTIRFYGTPAEEVTGGKVYMVRAGLFDDLDACLTWHPGAKTKVAVDSSQAIVEFIIEFFGQTAHAAGDPWDGRSAVAAMELYTAGLNRMREFVRPTVRMHYSILNGGDVPNVVPAYARLWCWLRDSKGTGVQQLMDRARHLAEGAALMAEVEQKLTVHGGNWETLVNLTGEKLIFNNMNWLGPIKFTPEEQEFAKEIQKSLGLEPKGLDEAIQPWATPKPDPEGGSTDVGDVSWQVPTLSFNVTTAPLDTPWHAWPVVACGGMSIGHKGLIYAAQILATTMVDMYENPKYIKAMKEEFEQKRKGVAYKPFVPEGPPIIIKK